jgi:glucose/arabinose dehydrogenase
MRAAARLPGILLLLCGLPVTPFVTAQTVSAEFDGSLDTVRIASGLNRPTFATAPSTDFGRLFVVEQDGRIRVIRNRVLLGTPFLDISALTRSPADPNGGSEEGLLGMAFHPGHASNGWFFVYHTDATGANNIVARYTVTPGNPDLADASSRQVVLTIPHPSNDNHYGWMLAFGPMDGLLYIGTCDGGAGCDPPCNAQNISTNLGKILRINVDSLPYTIPPGNPFVGVAGNDEIWAYGLRNPWRFSFDRATGAIYIGDVGQNVWEEIDCRAPGATGPVNYGWDSFEGSFCPNPSCGSQGSCALPNLSSPIQEYSHSSPAGSCAVTGGYVYRGNRMKGLRGTYFYSDFCSAFIKSFRTGSTCSVSAALDRTADLAPGGGLSIDFITSYAEDAAGEIYILDQGGEVFKIVPRPPVAGDPGPFDPIPNEGSE